jgi:hypothetical protein
MDIFGGNGEGGTAKMRADRRRYRKLQPLRMFQYEAGKSGARGGHGQGVPPALIGRRRRRAGEKSSEEGFTRVADAHQATSSCD